MNRLSVWGKGEKIARREKRKGREPVHRLDGERNKKNFHFRKTFSCIQNFREINTKALVISKSLKFPQDDRTDTNFVARLRMHFERSKSTLDSLKRLFNAFRRITVIGCPLILNNLTKDYTSTRSQVPASYLYTPNCNNVVIEKSKKPNRNKLAM